MKIVELIIKRLYYDTGRGTFSSEIMQELIRCKDCKWYDCNNSLCDNTVGLPVPREETFFCADGTHKD